MLSDTFTFIITSCIVITVFLEDVLILIHFKMLNTACCVGLLVNGAVNTLCSLMLW